MTKIMFFMHNYKMNCKAWEKMGKFTFLGQTAESGSQISEGGGEMLAGVAS